MSKFKSITAVVVMVVMGLLASVLFNFSAGNHVEAQTVSTTKWETKMIRSYGPMDSLQASVNKLGGDGWELVQVIEYGADKSPSQIAFLKRPRP